MADETALARSSPVQPGAADAAEATATEPVRPLPEAAKRALAEAEERRRARAAAEPAAPEEIGGRNGPDPVRYGDWEKDGIVSDF